MVSNGIIKFTSQIKKLIVGNKAKGRAFRKAVGQAFSDVGENIRHRDTVLAAHLAKKVGHSPATSLGNIIHSCHMKGVGNLNTAIALYCLTLVDDDFSLQAPVIEAALFGKGKSFRTVFSWSPEPFSTPKAQDEPPTSAQSPSLRYEPQLRLRPPGVHGHPSHFSNRTIERIVGRATEEKALQSFVEPEPGFRWLQLAGAGGQGKSRMAFDLMNYVGDGWDRGFLDNGDLIQFQGPKNCRLADSWRRWRPAKPHLIIIDYVVGRENDIGYAMNQMSDYSSEFDVPVCVLIIERQRWDRGAFELSTERTDSIPILTEGKADWFVRLNGREEPTGRWTNDLESERFRFGSGVVELNSLSSDDLLKIVRHLMSGKDDGSKLSDDFIKEYLARIDQAGRPLFAYFLSQSLADGAFRPNWNKANLLQYAFTEHCRKRWKISADPNDPWGPCPKLGESHPALRLAVLSTMVRFVDCRHLIAQTNWPPIDSLTRRQALALADGPIDGGPVSIGDIIPALEPDILGEWLVLTSISSNSGSLDLIDYAGDLNISHFIEFLIRAAQDFYDQKSLQNIIYYKSKNKATNAALLGSRVHLGVILSQKNVDERKGLSPIRLFEDAAIAGHGTAMMLLAQSFHEGVDTEQDIGRAIEWYEKSADTGNLISICNLAGIYLSDKYGLENIELFRFWSEEAAKLGDISSMLVTGLCYAEGQGVAKNLVTARKWMRKAAILGNSHAMFTLGMLYIREEKWKSGKKWLQAAAEADFSEAMYILAILYAVGFGVNSDSELARFWLQKSRDNGFNPKIDSTVNWP